MTKKEVLDFLSSHKSELEGNFGVTKLGLAGSYARNEVSDESDLDIIVEIKSENKFRSFFNLLHFLEDSLNTRIDLATEISLKPLVRETIMKDIIYV